MASISCSRLVKANFLPFRFLLSQRGIFETHTVFSPRQEVSRYHEPSRFKKHLLASCQPYYNRDYRRASEKCVRNKTKLEVKDNIHPLEEIYAKELKEDLRSSDVHLILHRNYVPFQSARTYRNTITKLEGKMQQNINNRILRLAFSSIGRPEALRFFYSHTGLITGKSERLNAYLKALSRMPQLPLLAGYVGPYLLNKDQLTKISQSGDLLNNLSSLSLTLSLQSMHLSHILSQHVQTSEKAATD